ncbi:MAG TPA: hypothetical protein VNO30_34615 [Kofleriaceae bacterium]|nr:hypothetical protein [Kofleriaceae bacterium]
MISTSVLLSAAPAHAAELVWIYNKGSSARGTIDKVNANVAADDIKKDGRSAVTRWQARDRRGKVIDRDVCIDSHGANNGYKACHVRPRAYLFISVCTRDFSKDGGYKNCTAWEGFGWVP